MNKKYLVLSAALLLTMAGMNLAYAEDNAVDASKVKGNVETNKPDFGEFQGPPPAHEFGAPPMKHHPPRHFEGKRPSPEEMQAKKAEFEKRLKLTDEQKEQIELQKQQDREKIKPIINDIHIKKQEFKTILEDESLSQADKDKKLKELKDGLRELKGQAEELRKENMNNFESILTDKQKKEFSKIKEEQKKEMEQRRKHFEKRMQKEGRK